jgi:ATP adenylyltransferase
VILNLFPYNNGHLMIVPNRHVATLASLTPDERDELMVLAQRAEQAVGEAYRPEGLNVGLNLGRPAGAGIADHLHVHVVPRWTGDTNFISVVGQVRVLPEELETTAARLRPIFERLAAEAASAVHF